MADDVNNNNNTWNDKSGSFVKRPGKGWLHPDDKLQSDEIVYNIKYVGLITVNQSMKSLSFETRTLVARESIRRVAEAARIKDIRKNRKIDENINQILSQRADLQSTGTEVALHINIHQLRVHKLGNDEPIFQHHMQNISFACGGDTDIQDFVAYVAKDEPNRRACYVFECPNGLANNVITTIGQAFELRFKKFLHTFPQKNMQQQQQPPPLPSSTIPNAKDNNINTVSPNGNENIMFKKSTGNDNQIMQNQRLNGNTFNENISPTHRIDENLNSMIWFHGLMTRENAEKLLKHDGDFLVRTSTKVDKQYVLSGRYQNECRHIFLVDQTGVVRTKDRVFDNISHLIKYHQDYNIPIISKDNELLLLNPVPRQ